MARQLDADIRAVSGQPVDRTAPDDRVTVLATSSPVPIHPSTDHIEQVVASIREQLPTAEIVVVCDGVRPEQENRRADYDEYVRRLLWLCNYEWSNVLPVVLDEWQHQANATRVALGFVETPLVLFVEHDTPMVGEIDWGGVCALVSGALADAVQFHENTEIHPDHESVMVDAESCLIDGVPVRRIAAWWQRPHLAKTSLYKTTASL